MMNVSTIQLIGIGVIRTVSQEAGRNKQRLHLKCVLIGITPIDTFIPGELRGARAGKFEPALSLEA